MLYIYIEMMIAWKIVCLGGKGGQMGRMLRVCCGVLRIGACWRLLEDPRRTFYYFSLILLLLGCFCSACARTTAALKSGCSFPREQHIFAISFSVIP